MPGIGYSGRNSAVMAMTPEYIALLLLTVSLGGVLAVIFFGGLWLTVKHLPYVKHPALLMLGSLAIRTCLVMMGLYWLTNENMLRLLAAFLGFIAVRWLMLKKMRPAAPEGRVYDHHAG